MDFNISNFIDIRSRKSKIGDFQDLDHIDGVAVSTVNAGLYKEKRKVYKITKKKYLKQLWIA